MVPAGPPRRHPNAVLDRVIPVVLMLIAGAVIWALAVLLVTPPRALTPAFPTAAPPPTPDPLLRALAAAQATWYAPRPTATAVPTPTAAASWRPTAVVYCGAATRKGTTCKWPPPPLPTPTPYPPCNTPVPHDICVWEKP